jgi:hypothetical protein
MSLFCLIPLLLIDLKKTFFTDFTLKMMLSMRSGGIDHISG